jgi:hypothetical protein
VGWGRQRFRVCERKLFVQGVEVAASSTSPLWRWPHWRCN